MTYKFMGWEFVEAVGCNGLLLEKKLHHPHPPESTYSYHMYGPAFPKERAAAWLISHWYEHLLNICPCTYLPDKNNNFRRAFIETLL